MHIIHACIRVYTRTPTCLQGIHSECIIWAIQTGTGRPGFSHTCIFDRLSRHMLGLQSEGTMQPRILHHVSINSYQCIPVLSHVAVTQSCWPHWAMSIAQTFTGCLMYINVKTILLCVAPATKMPKKKKGLWGCVPFWVISMILICVWFRFGCTLYYNNTRSVLLEHT